MKYAYCPLLIILLLLACNTDQNEGRIQPSQKDISEFIYASVNVVSENAYQCRPSMSGIIEKVLVKKGEEIKKGQTLFIISPTPDAKNRLNNSIVNLKEAKENLYGNNNKLNSIEVDLINIRQQNLIDSSNYKGRLRLWEQGIGSKNELERTLLTYQASSSRLESFSLQYGQAKTILQNSYAKAQNQVKTERNLLGDLEISSQIDGKVFKIFKEAGELISTQEVFAEIGSFDNFIIRMNIDEVDIPKIELGDTSIIQLEAYPDKVYTSKLIYISDMKDNATQTFMVEGLFIEAPTKLYSGLSGEANILVERRKDAIIIPSEYIMDGSKVLTENGPLNVEIGVKNFEYVEILEGIDSSTILLRPDIQ